jgi:hypothetical protein
MIYVVEIENDEGLVRLSEYHCASVVEALATAQLELRKHSLCYVTNIYVKGSESSDLEGLSAPSGDTRS